MTWPSWRTPWNCSLLANTGPAAAAAATQKASPRSTIRAWNARTSRTLAAELNVPFAPITPATARRLANAIDPGHQPGNPLDVWATGRDTEPLFAECLAALAADPEVAAVALAVDLVPEFDGDEAYPLGVLAAAARTAKPVAVLAGLPAAVDPVAASRLRASGVPVLEGTRTGLLALRHLLEHADRPEPPAPATPGPRRERWAPVLAAGPPGTAVLFDLLRDYGIPAVRVQAAGTRAGALAAAAEIGYPVVLKTDEPAIAARPARWPPTSWPSPREAGQQLAHDGTAERRQRVPHRAPLAARLDQVRVAQHLRVLGRRGRADPDLAGELRRAARFGQRA